MVRRTLTLATALLLSLTMACTWSQKFMAGGAAVGAGIGAIAGAHHAAAGCGAAIGAASGAIVGGIVGSVLDYNEIKRLKAENDQLRQQLAQTQQELAAAKARIAELENELAKLRQELANARVPIAVIELAAETLFRPGSARLSAQGKGKLNDAAGRIQSEFKGKFIMIEGHTDSQPIKHSSWKSNWELGAARALTVLHYLEEKGVDPAMLSAATFSKYQPIATNDTPEGRRQNRRAAIVIYNAWPRAQAPAK